MAFQVVYDESLEHLKCFLVSKLSFQDLEIFEQWWGLVFWMMLLKACTMLRREAKDRSWLGLLQKLSSSSLLLCKNMVCLFNPFPLNLSWNILISPIWLKQPLLCFTQVTLVSLSMLMITDQVRLWLNWMEDWTNVELSVLDLMLVSRKLNHGLLDFSLQDRLV